MASAVSAIGNLFGMGKGGNAGGNVGTAMGLPKGFGAELGNVGSVIAGIGNASSGVIPGQAGPASAVPMVHPSGVSPIQAAPGQIQAAVNTAGATGPMAVQSAPSTGTIPQVGAGVYNGGDVNSVYGQDTGTAITNLMNSENSGTAGSLAQAVINANQPNVDRGSASLNTQLAASGISPSSSVSAIENANYEAGVQQQNLSQEAQFALQEQQMQQQLLETLLPSQQQRQTDSSGWSIFGDVMQGVGDVMML